MSGTDTADELRLAAAYLSRVAEPASVPLWQFVSEHGYLEAASAIRAGTVPAEVAACTEARRTSADPHTDLAAADRNDIRLMTPADDDWPHFAFAGLNAAVARRITQWRAGQRARPPRGELVPPLALWVRGQAALRSVGTCSIAMVGSRAATAYGEQIASEFAYGLSLRDVVVVSGGAYGIDAAAHRGALAAGGTSILVSAGGLDRPYPGGNQALYDQTVASGLLISERPPGSAPHRQRFLSRNRIIAALGSAMLVVEAGARSGALNSAGYARDLGRPVLAIPGPVTSAMSAGCHRLLQRHDRPAYLVTSIADVLGFCGRLDPLDDNLQPGTSAAQLAGPDDAGSRQAAALPRFASGAAARTAGYDSLDPTARAILDGFPARRTVTETELARLSGQPIGQVRIVLPSLLELGLVTAFGELFQLAGSSVAR